MKKGSHERSIKAVLEELNKQSEQEKALEDAILDLRDFKEGWGLSIIQIETALRKERGIFPDKKDLLFALQWLCNHCKLISAVVQDEDHNRLIAHTFWPLKTILSEDVTVIPVEKVLEKPADDETKEIEIETGES